MRFNAMRLLAGVLALGLLGGCAVYDKVVYSGREGTVEQPGSAAEPGSSAIYVVASGDTVNGIARRFNVSPETIIQRNNLQPPHTIRVGQWLEVPASGAAMASAPGPASSGIITPGAVTSQPLPPPSGVSSAPVSSAPASTERAPPAAGAPATVTPSTAAPTTPAAPPNTQTAARPAAPASGPVKFDWPLRGQLVGTFGPASGGVQNDGINIAVPRGTPVKAAAAGNVLYSGEEVRGFGKLVLIGHADGYVTAYAHNDELSVARGAAVAKGQVIAKSGQSGNVTSPQLHFEIRQRNKAIDPLPLLGQ
jgi:murein DD-endopeptidase MepM/ murein hydrolase activator NlpD